MKTALRKLSPRASQRLFMFAVGVTYAALVVIALLGLSFASITHSGIYAAAFLWPWVLCRFPRATSYLVPLLAISYAYSASSISGQLAATLAAGVLTLGMVVAWRHR